MGSQQEVRLPGLQLPDWEPEAQGPTGVEGTPQLGSQYSPVPRGHAGAGDRPYLAYGP